MGLFGAPTPCETDVEKATDEKNTKEEWGLIMEVCDKAGKSPQAAKEYMRTILKRINHSDPHIAIQAVTLLDACIKNCGTIFHVEIASREFENEYVKLLKKSHPTINKKLKESLKKWAENEFKTDPQLNLIPSLYTKLRTSGMDFHVDEQPKRSVALSKDPNVVQSQDEEDQIAKAIELSLKETSGAGGTSPRNSTGSSNNYSSSTNSNSVAASSLYPSTNVGAVAMSSKTSSAKEQRKVRALYDFEAAEDNELTFNAGEIIFIIDDSDPNWWKGSNQRGEGLFPANFVTTDLNLDPDQLIEEKKKKIELLDDSLDKRLDEMKEEVTEIDESKINRLLHLLHEADPTNPEYDTKEMLGLEREVNSMGTLIDKELEKVDRKHAQLTQLSSDLVEALSLYHSLMREPQFAGVSGMKQPYPQYAAGPHGGPPPNHMPPQMMYNGNVPPHQQPPHPSMMYNTLPHDRNFMPPQGGPMLPPNHYNTLPPPNMMHPHQQQGGGPPPPHQQQQQQQQHGMPPMSAPPHMQQSQMQPPPPHMAPNDPRGFHPQLAFNGNFQGAPPNQQNASFTSLPPPPASNIM